MSAPFLPVAPEMSTPAQESTEEGGGSIDSEPSFIGESAEDRALAARRFWARVRKTETCWLWVGGKRGGGYGKFWNGTRFVGAHRFAYEEAFGQIERGEWVLHHCDVPACVNPAHLFPGTVQDNVADMLAKGRHPSQAPTERQLEILAFIADGLKRNGFPPSIRDIGSALEIRSTNGVNDHLEALVRKGLLTRQRMSARAIALTPEGFGLLAERRLATEGESKKRPFAAYAGRLCDAVLCDPEAAQ